LARLPAVSGSDGGAEIEGGNVEAGGQALETADADAIGATASTTRRLSSEAE